MTHQPSIKRSSNSEHLSGTIERVTYYDPESGFCVIQVKIKDHRFLVKVIGSTASVSVGEFIQAKGQWDHRIYTRFLDHRIQLPTLGH